MTSASPDLGSPLNEVDVLLEIGHESRCFTYLDSRRLGVGLGDLVSIRLRGRLIHGVVVAIRTFIKYSSQEKSANTTKQRPLNQVESLIQSSAIDPYWREWLEAVASRCYVSPIKMLKAALPPGWLNASRFSDTQPRKLWWVQLVNVPFEAKVLPKRQKELEDYLICRGGGAWQKDLLSEGFSLAVLKAFVSNERASRCKRMVDHEKGEEGSNGLEDKDLLEEPRPLTDEQKIAIQTFEAQPPGEALLLWGVTGSGKTEVYLQIVAKELDAGRHCLILTPEIGLIPQLVDRCRKRFGLKVMEYHSGCSQRERVRTWLRGLRSESPLVVVGTRSAIFLPLSPLGLIVLDEEHDSSYKQESPMPCYHARELALDRAKRHGVKVVLGTATPSLFTWKSIVPNGSIALTRLTRRIANRPLPLVHVVDMRQELAEGHRRLISRPVMERLAALPGSGEQGVILVPRRGYSSFLSCRSCGAVVQCPHCDVALTVHRGQQGSQWLRCHWCDHRATIQSNCGECGSTAFKPFGAGTQRVMEHLAKELEGLRFLRFDRDTTGGRDGHRRLLEQFASGEADVLIGTQMLSKGMDLPRVTLAIVLAADGLLHRPDLQAEEQCLQLFMQLGGRAGRGELPGKVLVQTYCPEHPVISHFVDGCYEEFLKQELIVRKEGGLVPFCRACLLRFSGYSAAMTATAAASVAEQIRPLCDSYGWQLIGPAPAMIAKVAGKSRWQLLLHGPEASDLPLPEGAILWNGLPKGISLSIDPDPIQL